MDGRGDAARGDAGSRPGLGYGRGREARQGAGRGGGSSGPGRRVREAAGWREKAGGAGGIWSVEFVAPLGMRGGAREDSRGFGLTKKQGSNRFAIERTTLRNG